MNPSEIQPMTYVDFQLLDSPALPGEYRRFYVLGSLTGQMVTNLDPNIPTLYNQVLPTLPNANLPTNYQDALYLVGKDASGTSRAIAHAWIRPNSISVAQRHKRPGLALVFLFFMPGSFCLSKPIDGKPPT